MLRDEDMPNNAMTRRCYGIARCNPLGRPSAGINPCPQVYMNASLATGRRGSTEPLHVTEE